MATFNFNGSSIDFSRYSYEDVFESISSINNIYSSVITENSSSRLSFQGYLYNSYYYSASLNISGRSGNSLNITSLNLTLYSGSTIEARLSADGKVSFDGLGITGGYVTQESYSDIYGNSFSYSGYYDVIRTTALTNNSNYRVYIYLTSVVIPLMEQQSDYIESGKGNDLILGGSGNDHYMEGLVMIH